jgi:hypothetical protein
MSHTVTSSPHPDFYVLTHFDDLQYDELFLDEELHLNEGRSIYILADTSRMNNVLPDGFLDAVTKSYVINPNMAHLAVYIPSTALRVVGYMVIKVTRRQKQISIHHTYEDALHTIEALLPQRTPSISSQTRQS